MRMLLPKLPRWAKTPLRRTRNIIKALSHYRKGRYCPVCGKSSRRFKPFGRAVREDAQCAHCGALERHRFVWLFFQKNTNIFDDKPKKILHVAPEPCFESIFKDRLGSNYLTADLFNPRAMIKMDICDIQYPDRSFDVIYCSHVLEHVLDDKRAMRELFRVLNSNGWAILNVPISSEKTFEDPLIVDPKERLKAFGQEDHVRHYGPDYVERLRDSGFTVEITKVADLASSDDAVRMGLTQASGEIYYCTK
ncbi:class I SAM-dependent methyltransferase [Azotobacter chroococcum]|uniref:Methyltransferase domain-containing protein n=1 Tax=Azotobacter chroococcum TaxID=353 RepID=A0AAP9YAS2_9GAMM|nr:class I SAM-dependent methyltransferase [Azotobacter chroococcum]QQE87186.1 methyltransferase domain-containing protein [Azotobacter chroococcum]